MKAKRNKRPGLKGASIMMLVTAEGEQAVRFEMLPPVV